MNQSQQVTISRNLRRRYTEAEKALWYKIRDRQLSGIKFRRQQVIGDYVVDFISHKLGLILEIDGGQHNLDVERAKDEVRTAFLNSRGFTVIRFWNNDVLQNMDGVIAYIEQVLSEFPPHPDPLPRRGEGNSCKLVGSLFDS